MLARVPLAAPIVYRRREPEKTVLYQCVAKHWPTFRAHAEQCDRPVPKFVQRELESYIPCGRIEEGCVRVRCPACGFDPLVARASRAFAHHAAGGEWLNLPPT
jgi:hypothetical protein